jgi:hypothetical protein
LVGPQNLHTNNRTSNYNYDLAVLCCFPKKINPNNNEIVAPKKHSVISAIMSIALWDIPRSAQV